jgi:uncharacterized membrane protein
MLFQWVLGFFYLLLPYMVLGFLAFFIMRKFTRISSDHAKLISPIVAWLIISFIMLVQALLGYKYSLYYEPGSGEMVFAGLAWAFMAFYCALMISIFITKFAFKFFSERFKRKVQE